MKITAGGFAIIRLKFGSLSQDAVDNINLIVETCYRDWETLYLVRELGMEYTLR